MSGVQTKVHFDKSDGSMTVESIQDVEPFVEYRKEQAKLPNPRGDKFRPKWSLAPIDIIKFYNAYTLGDPFPKPMNDEFWKWVDKKIMSDADNAHYRTFDPSNQFFSGFKSKT